MERIIGSEELRNYIALSEKMAEMESKLYEAGDQLSQEEFKIEQVMAQQNKIRFDEQENDLFRKQMESILKTLAANYKDFGFDNNLYFDLVYNLIFLEFEKFDSLYQADGVKDMLTDIGIDQYMRDRIKGLLEHECGCESC